jgi:hypothetical protein
MFCNMTAHTVSHEEKFLRFPSALVWRCSCSCASSRKMADKGRLSVVQCIKTMLFFTEIRSVAFTQRQSRAHFQTRLAPSFETIHKFYNQFNNDVSLLETKRHQPSSVRTPENTDDIRVALENQHGSLQNSKAPPDDRCNVYCKLI